MPERFENTVLTRDILSLMQACLNAEMDHKSHFNNCGAALKLVETCLRSVVCTCITGLMVVHLVELRGLHHYSIILHPCVLKQTSRLKDCLLHFTVCFSGDHLMNI